MTFDTHLALLAINAISHGHIALRPQIQISSKLNADRKLDLPESLIYGNYTLVVGQRERLPKDLATGTEEHCHTTSHVRKYFP